MRQEIMALDNQHGIEKMILDTEAQGLELVLKEKESDPTGKDFAMALVSQKRIAMAIGRYEVDSFTIKLPEKNHIVMKGRVDNMVDMLKTVEIIDESIAKQLDDLVAKMGYNSDDSEKPSSELMEEYRPASPISSFFSAEEKRRDSGAREEIDRKPSKKEEEKHKVIIFFKSLGSEEKESIKEFLTLLGELTSLERDEVLQKLSAEGEIPKITIGSQKR